MPHEVQVVQLPPGRIAAMREMIPMAKMPERFGALFPAAHQHLSEQGAAELGHVVAVYHDMTEDAADVSAGIEVSRDFDPQSPLETLDLPACEAAVVQHYGPYTDLPAAHAAVQQWLAANNREPVGPPAERYITDPESEPDPSKWLTEVVWPIKWLTESESQ